MAMQLIVDLYDCQPDRLDDAERVRQTAHEGVDAIGAEIGCSEHEINMLAGDIAAGSFQFVIIHCQSAADVFRIAAAECQMAGRILVIQRIEKQDSVP